MDIDRTGPDVQIGGLRDALVGWTQSFRADVRWSERRLAVLKAKADDRCSPDFQQLCAAGQLAVAEGRYDEAEQTLLSVLIPYLNSYPRNGHRYHHLMQLAISMQALDFASMLLNDSVNLRGSLNLVFDNVAAPPDTNWVTANDARQCFIALAPEMIGHPVADFFFSQCLSSAPLWASYCDSVEFVPGRTIMNSGDAAAMPGLAYCGDRPEHILVPDNYFLGSLGYADLRSRYASLRPDWSERRPVAFWRGSTTGRRTDLMDWRSLPRIRLCQISRDHPDILDAGISAAAQMRSDEERAEIAAASFVRGPVPQEGFLPYKYRIDIDGNTNSWSGLYQGLLSGSTVLKVASPHGFRQWYYDRLIPWVNHVPVSSDMSDLIEKIEWLRCHDAEARTIGEAGQALAESLDYESELISSHMKIREAFQLTDSLTKDGSADIT